MTQTGTVMKLQNKIHVTEHKTDFTFPPAQKRQLQKPEQNRPQKSKRVVEQRQ